MSQTVSIKYKRVAYNEEEIREGLFQQEEWAVRWIYQTQYKAIKKMVYTFNNITLDPDDVFQEGLARAILNIRLGKFRGDCAFATYLNSICHNICLKELNRHKEQLPGILPGDQPDNPSNDFYDLLDAVLTIREELNEKCRAIIDLRFQINSDHQPERHGEQELNRLLPFENIAGQLNISPDNARQRFIRCLKQLKELVFKDPMIKEHLASVSR